MAENLFERKNIYFFVTILLIFASIFAATLFFIMVHHERSEHIRKENETPRIYSFDPMVIAVFNRNDSGQPELSGHLKIRVAVALAGKSSEDLVLKDKMACMDLINNRLTGKTMAELYDSNSKNYETKRKILKEEILNSLNNHFKGKIILDVHFSEYFVE